MTSALCPLPNHVFNDSLCADTRLIATVEVQSLEAPHSLPTNEREEPAEQCPVHGQSWSAECGWIMPARALNAMCQATQGFLE